MIGLSNGSVKGKQAEVFVRSGARWVPEAELVPSLASFNNGYGEAVALRAMRQASSTRTPLLGTRTEHISSPGSIPHRTSARSVRA